MVPKVLEVTNSNAAKLELINFKLAEGNINRICNAGMWIFFSGLANHLFHVYRNF